MDTRILGKFEHTVDFIGYSPILLLTLWTTSRGVVLYSIIGTWWFNWGDPEIYRLFVDFSSTAVTMLFMKKQQKWYEMAEKDTRRPTGQIRKKAKAKNHGCIHCTIHTMDGYHAVATLHRYRVHSHYRQEGCATRIRCTAAAAVCG